MLAITAGKTDSFPFGIFVDEAGESIAKRWWLLHTKSRQEKAVSRDLHSRQIGFYLPLLRRQSLVRGRLFESLAPLFPSYVFLFGTDEDRITALRTNRLAAAHAVADDESLRVDLEQIARLIATGAPLTPEARLEPGQRVRVKSGPCIGFEGTLIKRHGKSRLVVRVEQLFQGASVEIEDYRLEAI